MKKIEKKFLQKKLKKRKNKLFILFGKIFILLTLYPYMLTSFDLNAILTPIGEYIQNELIASVFSGSLTALIMFAIILLFLFFIFFKTPSSLLSLLKRIFLLLIVVASAYFFLTSLTAKTQAELLEPSTLAVAYLGLVFTLIAFVITAIAMKRQVKPLEEVQVPELEEIKLEEAVTKAQKAQSLSMKERYSSMMTDYLQPRIKNIKNERSLLAILSYVTIAEFGVFSTKTIAAPTIEIGLSFFAIFFIGSIIFIHTSYKSYSQGLIHLLITSVFAFALSLLLGFFWANFTLETLLSINYFLTDSLVACITGIGLALVMGSRG